MTKPRILRNKHQKGYGGRRTALQRGDGKVGDFFRKIGRAGKRVYKSDAFKRTMPGIMAQAPQLLSSKDRFGAFKTIGKQALKDALQLGKGRLHHQDIRRQRRRNKRRL